MKNIQRKSRPLILFLLTALLFGSAWECAAQATDKAVPPAAPSYGELVTAAQAAKKAGNLQDAILTGMAAIKADDKRFEAYALCALIAHEQGKPADAKLFLDNAFARAPEDKKPRLLEMAKAMSAPPAKPTEVKPLNPQAQRQLDILMLISTEADRATVLKTRQMLLTEFLTKSEPFLKENPSALDVWLVRAVAALELNQGRVAWEAGRKLVALGAAKSDEAKTRNVLAILDRKGLFTESPPPSGPSLGEKYENSLGMKFVPVPGTDVLFSVWHTRVQDFEAFVKATGYDATMGMYSFGSDGSKQGGDTWAKPGFTQTGLHPVCGVSRADAQAFAKWLTEQERTEGRLTPEQSYRLPQDWEWSVAVGLNETREGTPKGKGAKNKGVYPWGNQWPPPAGAGNYAGEEAKGATWPSKDKVVAGYRDGFPRTSPVGSFNANKFGLYDMGGNLWQWCEDWWDGEPEFQVLRGGSWRNFDKDSLCASARLPGLPDRFAFNGFRLVMVVGSRP